MPSSTKKEDRILLVNYYLIVFNHYNIQFIFHKYILLLLLLDIKTFDNIL